MDYDRLADAFTEKTKAVIPVDIGGVPCDYDRIFEIVEKKSYICFVIDDDIHISESVFVSFVGNSQFQRQKDYDNSIRSCIGYAVCSSSRNNTPYQAECGVLSVVYFCQGPAKPPTR